ncbi:IcmC (DotE) [Legionella geestiana]|uniref:IcmC (DotE) n=1 Tax=Legionella geestiana TaxID=45065 RepID=A0A0W0TP56_9GAMM|nr:hypothetical protein [Legionella geestiana]KTC97377.1 IcmC (DotE) [Legionella geestiana]QBS12683.1 type IV secretion protein IcmC [Legionella geestiana]QDQ39600.1 type IV secretion protein IcmC [Legionella geestiana]STX54852.1 IcmC (DotE) [Legionella geestiana]
MADCDYNCVLGKIQDQANVLVRLAENLLPIERLLTGGAYVMGIAFAMKAVLALKSMGESRGMGGSNAMKEPLVYFMVAAVFVYFPTAMQVFMNTTFGYSNPLSYAPIDTGASGGGSIIDSMFGSGSAIGEPLTIIIQVIGLVAFLRGWILIARTASSGQPPGGTGKGMVHVFGGILAINIVGTLRMISATLYGTG